MTASVEQSITSARASRANVRGPIRIAVRDSKEKVSGESFPSTRGYSSNLDSKGIRADGCFIAQANANGNANVERRREADY